MDCGEPLPNKNSKIEMAVLPMGLSFIPRGTGMSGSSWNRLEAEVGLTAYHGQLRLAVFFEGDEEEGQRAHFTVSSGWDLRRSQVVELVWRIRRKIKKIMKEVKETWNRSKGKLEALKGLRKDSTLVIKPADKGSMVVIMDREQYDREAMMQLQGPEFYQELPLWHYYREH